MGTSKVAVITRYGVGSDHARPAGPDPYSTIFNNIVAIATPLVWAVFGVLAFGAVVQA